VVAGIQVMGLLGAALPKMVTIGWHGSKVLGVYGAAAAAGRILGLTPEQLVNAFGIAGSDASGGMEYDKSGGEVKRLHAGSASRSGLEAAELAQLGLTGPATIFEGPRGLLQLFGDGGDVTALDAIWDRWLVLDTIVRLYPSVATNHAPLDVIRKLREEHGIKAANVALDSSGARRLRRRPRRQHHPACGCYLRAVQSRLQYRLAVRYRAQLTIRLLRRGPQDRSCDPVRR
jgi:2-methylcitrate dehydratase PrpD